MKLGYFANQTNLGLRKPFHQIIDETREIAAVCDQAGWDSIWFTEHHFGFEGFEVCPNPVLMSADIAAHTKRIRIGQAANIVTFWHPVRLAEDIAMLDHMSGGRVEVGLGRGLYGREALNLNKAADTRNEERNRAIFEESVEILRRAWSAPYFDHRGKVYDFPDPGYVWDHAQSPKSAEYQNLETNELTRLALVPRTLQQPHPPLWQVIDTPRSIQWAAANGLKGIFWIPPVASLKGRFELYRDTASKARGQDCALGEGLALVRDMYVAETMDEARRDAGEGILAYLRWVCHWRGLGNHLNPGEELPKTPGKLDALTYDWLHPRNLLFGTPDYVVEKIKELQTELNLQYLMVWSSFPGVPHEKVMRSLKLFNEEVVPRIRPAEPALRRAAS
jgi:alkanesulfonate monooxygenase SsuD/methylene tetrahydromethanopterin reductase-like flavin-dependent oxidoreductase (luciferase family)